MKSKHICPRCGGKEFFTTAHVAQEWKVDEEGNFLECTDGCIDVDADPDDDNIWICTKCGAEGVLSKDADLSNFKDELVFPDGTKAYVNGTWLHEQCARLADSDDQGIIDALYENLSEEDGYHILTLALQDVQGSGLEADHPFSGRMLDELACWQNFIDAARKANPRFTVKIGVTDLDNPFELDNYAIFIDGRVYSNCLDSDTVSTILSALIRGSEL